MLNTLHTLHTPNIGKNKNIFSRLFDNGLYYKEVLTSALTTLPIKKNYFFLSLGVFTLFTLFNTILLVGGIN